MAMRVMVWTLGALVLLGGGCFALTDFEDLQTTRRETFELPFVEQGALPQFDILFVVDRPTVHDVTMWNTIDDMALQSGDMPEALGASYDNQGPGVWAVELHIGVITSDLGSGLGGFNGCDLAGDDGILRSDVLPAAEYGEYGCEPLADGDKFIRVVDGVVENMGSVSDVSAAVQCLILAQMTRTTTCPIKQPLRAVQRALSDHVDSANDLFLRDEGGLAVVFISGEDDCSADDYSVYNPALFGPYHCFSQGLSCVQEGNVFSDCVEPMNGVLMPTTELADLLGTAKGNDSVVVSVMAGAYDKHTGVLINEVPDVGMQIQQSCDASQTSLVALPAIRLSLLQEQFADNALFQDICAPDSGRFFDGVAHKLAAQISYRCMPKVPVDTDLSKPGMQALCDIVDVINPGMVGIEDRTDPYDECNVSGYGNTCWEMLPEQGCTAGYKLVLQRAPGDHNESLGYIVEADCLVHMEDPGSP